MVHAGVQWAALSQQKLVQGEPWHCRQRANGRSLGGNPFFSKMFLDRTINLLASWLERETLSESPGMGILELQLGYFIPFAVLTIFNILKICKISSCWRWSPKGSFSGLFQEHHRHVGSRWGSKAMASEP